MQADELSHLSVLREFVVATLLPCIVSFALGVAVHWFWVGFSPAP
jgi:hypothetical protein